MITLRPFKLTRDGAIGVSLLKTLVILHLIKKFTSDVLKTLVLFILILILMKLMVLMLDLVLFLTICQRIYMRLPILILKMLAPMQYLMMLATAGYNEML